MRYTLAAEEEQKLVHPNNPSTAQDLRADALHCSTSSWDQAHLDALKVYHLNDLPLERFFEPHELPGDDDAGD